MTQKTLGEQIAGILYKHNTVEQIVHIGTKIEVKKEEGNTAPHEYKQIQLCAKLHPLALDGIHIFGLVEDDYNNQRWPTDLAGYITGANSYSTSQAQLLEDGKIGTRFSYFPKGIESLDQLITSRGILFATSNYIPNTPVICLREDKLAKACSGVFGELEEQAIKYVEQSIITQIKTGRDYMRGK